MGGGVSVSERAGVEGERVPSGRWAPSPRARSKAHAHAAEGSWLLQLMPWHLVCASGM
jgi:hypothetical protein